MPARLRRVCVFVCMYVCMYVCMVRVLLFAVRHDMYVLLCVCIYVMHTCIAWKIFVWRLHACILVFMYLCYTDTCACLHMRGIFCFGDYMYVLTCVRMHVIYTVCMRTCACKFFFLAITCMFSRVYVYMLYIHVYVYMCVDNFCFGEYMYVLSCVVQPCSRCKLDDNINAICKVSNPQDFMTNKLNHNNNSNNNNNNNAICKVLNSQDFVF
jgi:hypothetical protein